MDEKRERPIDSLLKALSYLLSQEKTIKFQTIDNLLSYILSMYEENVDVSAMAQFADFTESAVEAIGHNSLFLIKNLPSIGSNKIETYPFIKRYVTDLRFHEYCTKTLNYFENAAKEELQNRQDPTTYRSLEERQEESERENQHEIAILYEQSRAYKSAAEKALEEAKLFKKEAAEAKKAAESLIPNMLAVLGVFIAIIIAVVACYLSLIFNQHQADPLPPLNILMCLLMGQIIMDIVFLLLYLISKLTNYTLACHCFISRETDCSQCPEEYRNKCRILNRIWLRYPYIVILNTLFVFCYFSLGLWEFLTVYIGTDISSVLNNSPQIVICTTIGLILLFIIICKIIFGKMRWKTIPKKTLAERHKARKGKKQMEKNEKKAQKAQAKHEKNVKFKQLKKDVDLLAKRVDELEKNSSAPLPSQNEYHLQK